MPRRQWLFIAAIAMLVAGIIVVDQRLSPPATPPGHSERTQKSETQASDKDKTESVGQRLAADPVSLATLAVAIATGVLAASTLGLWGVTRRSVKIAEQSLLDVERALVIVSNVSIYALVRSNRVFGHRITVMLTNTGRTVGKRFVTNANVAIFDGDDAVPSGFRYPDRSKPSLNYGIVGPSVKMPIPLDIAIQNIVAIQLKQKTGIIYGWAEYNDIFTHSARHRIEFCARLEIVGDPHRMPAETGGGASPLGFSAYGRYNGIDDECLYKPGETPLAFPGEMPDVTQPPPPDQLIV